MSKVITICNQKGGVGKTTTAMALAEGLNKNGYKTLLVDIDPQGNATDTFNSETAKATIYEVIIEGEDIKEAVLSKDGIDFISGDIRFCAAEKEMNDTGREYALKKALSPILENYEYVLIDTPPSLGILLINGLTAANEIIIPLTADRYSLQGLRQLRETMEPVREYTNPNLMVMGLLLTKYKGREKLSQSVKNDLSEIEAMFESKAFNTTIRECVATREAQATKECLLSYAPKSTTAQDYADLTKEIIERS